MQEEHQENIECKDGVEMNYPTGPALVPSGPREEFTAHFLPSRAPPSSGNSSVLPQSLRVAASIYQSRLNKPHPDPWLTPGAKLV